MADDITTVSNAEPAPQDTTTAQDTPADQPVVQPEPPKVEETPAETPPVETPAEEKPKPEPAPEVAENPAPEVPQIPEPPKEEPTAVSEIEPAKPEEPNAETKVVSEAESKPPQTPQINLDELRTKANKERQDRKAEHLSEVEKLAKSKQINNDDVRELLHVSQSTATNYLEELTKQGKLKKSGKAKGTTYSS